MTDTAKPTAGPWTCMITSEFDGSPYVDDSVHSLSSDANPGDIICLSPERDGYTDSAKQWEANARLIAEAGTVYHETGLTPRQLVEQRDGLLKALRCAVNMALPLIGSPTDEQLVDYWTHEKEQGRGCADDMLFIMQTLLKVEAKP